MSSDGIKTDPEKVKLLKHGQCHLMSKSFKASSDLLAITGNSSLGFPSLLNLCTSCVGRLCRLVGNRDNRQHSRN